MFDKIKEIPIYNLFILFLVIAANFIGELFPCRIQDLLSKNELLKHFIGFLTLLFFVVLTDTNVKKQKFNVTFTNSLKLYLLWLILINNEKNFFIFNLIITGALYIIYLNKQDYEDEPDNPNLILFDKIEKVIYILFIISLLSGFIIYLGQKKFEYKNKFSYYHFVFGKPGCKGSSPDISYLNSLKMAFT